jgi:uncharacterized protein
VDICKGLGDISRLLLSLFVGARQCLALNMKQDEVLVIVEENRQQLQELEVKSLELFGSVARDEASPDSDVEFNRPVGLFDFSRVWLYLEDILGCTVDMGTQDALKEQSLFTTALPNYWMLQFTSLGGREDMLHRNPFSNLAHWESTYPKTHEHPKEDALVEPSM